jgi:hypothetical protein
MTRKTVNIKICSSHSTLYWVDTEVLCNPPLLIHTTACAYCVSFGFIAYNNAIHLTENAGGK